MGFVLQKIEYQEAKPSKTHIFVEVSNFNFALSYFVEFEYKAVLLFEQNFRIFAFKFAYVVPDVNESNTGTKTPL